MRVVVAFLAGVASAVLVMLALQRSPDSRSAEDAASVGAERAEVPEPAGPRLLAVDDPEVSAPEGPAAGPSTALADERTAPGSRVASALTGPRRTEIGFASEWHAQLLRSHGNDDPDGQRGMHALLERETRDESWAIYSESLLREFFAKPPLAGAIDARVIACGSTLCEIQAISFEPERAGYHRVLADLQIQPWYRDTFAMSASTGGGHTDDGHAGILIFLKRADAAR